MIICKNNIFVLETKNTHYVFGVDKFGYNRHLHWGRKCDTNDYFIKNVCEQNSNISMLDEYKQEYTAFGQTVYRGSALKAEFSDGCRDILLQYNGYDIDKNTLKLRFSDKVYPFIITLNYAVSDDNDIITRWTAVENHSDTSVFFEKLSRQL